MLLTNEKTILLRAIFGFVGAAYLSGQSQSQFTVNCIMKTLQHLQRQCKYYRCKRNEYKNRKNILSLKYGKTEEFLMKNRTFLMVVAKGGVFGSWVVRWKLPKMLPWSHYPARLFYIMTSYSSWLSKKTITSSDMNYKTALCNTAWEKKLLAQVAKRKCF